MKTVRGISIEAHEATGRHGQMDRTDKDLEQDVFQYILCQRGYEFWAEYVQHHAFAIREDGVELEQ